jgi:hypothetical protein
MNGGGGTSLKYFSWTGNEISRIQSVNDESSNPTGFLAVRVGQCESRKLNARPQLQTIPISNLLGPAVAGRRSDE